MSTGTNSQRIITNNGIITDNNLDLDSIKSAIDNLPSSSDTTATASDILQGKTAVSKGVRLIGTLGTESKTVKSTTSQQTITPTTGKLINEIIVSPLDLETKNITPTTSAQTINPTSGKDGISQINVSAVDNTIDNNIQAGNIKSGVEILGVQGTYDPQPNLQSKQVTITQNTTTTVQPDSGYDGLQSVEVTTNVPLPASYPPDWSEIGYQTTPSSVINGFNHAKTIFDDWDNTETDLSYKFNHDYNLVYLPTINTTNAINMQGMFYNCQRLQNILTLDTARVTNIKSMFQNCTALSSVPALDTASVTDAQYMFSNCPSLQTVPVMNLSNLSGNKMYQMYANCTALTNESLNNILATCITASGISSARKTLQNLGLSGDQAVTCQSLPNYQAFLDAGWTTGY